MTMKYHILCKQAGTPESEHRICVGIRTNSLAEWQRLDWFRHYDLPMAFNIFKAKEIVEAHKALDVSPWIYWVEPAN